jgi:hypothetical protein
MFHTRWYRWTGVALGVVLGGGVAVAAPESGGSDTSAQEDQSSSGDTAGCKEAGVTVTFASGSTNINARGRTSLNAVAKWAKGEPGRTIRVDGYTDKTGNAEKNKVLSEKRADSVRTYLMAKGIDADRIVATGHGEETERPDLKNTRAVAVTACEPPKTAAAPPPEEKPAEPAPVAETVPEVPPPPPPPTVVETPPPPPPVVINNTMPAPAPRSDVPASEIGVGVTLGGGAVGFWKDGTKSFVDIGGTWDVRATLGTRLPIAFELAYVGTAQGMNALGLDTNAILLGSTAEGDVRINILRGRVQPYVFGGVGYTYYRITNTAIATSDLQRTDNVLEVPFGAGLSWRLGQALLLDVRGTGRLTYFDELFQNAATATNAGNSRLYNWMGTAHLGWEF